MIIMKTKKYKILNNNDIILSVNDKGLTMYSEYIFKNPKEFDFEIASSVQVYEHLFSPGYLSSAMYSSGMGYIGSSVSFEHLN